jgi:hypothetical protein
LLLVYVWYISESLLFLELSLGSYHPLEVPQVTHILPLLPALACIAMMFGMGAIARLAARTPLAVSRSRRSRRRVR